ncbi:MAG TPA: TolC family protein [Vicinamibacterales bacterium]|jgi:cobalt-zinc-cadmium efflux system outer membrane protein
MAGRRSIVFGLACAVLRVSTAYAQGPLTFEQALSMARARAPRVGVARARIDEARGRLTGAQVRFRDNPVVDAAVGPRWLEDGTVTDYDLGVSQRFELGNRRAVRIDAAEAAIARETALADASTRQVVRDVAVAFVRALRAQRRIEVLRAAEALAREAFDAADRRFRAGDIALLDLNLARGAVFRTTAQTRAAESERSAAVGELKALLAWSDPVDPQPAGDLLDSIRAGRAVQAVPSAERPEVQSLVAEAAEARADVRLGQAFKKPDLGFGVRVKRDEGNQAALGVFSIGLPFFNAGQEQVATGLAHERRADLERAAVVSEIELRARAARDTFARRVSVTEPLEQEVLPGLEENERLARRSFEVGELSLPDLLIVRREFVDTRLQYIEALAEAAIASIDWQMAAGVLR